MPRNSSKRPTNQLIPMFPDTEPREIEYEHNEAKYATRFSKESAPILGGKKTNNVLNLIGTLAVAGNSSVWKIAKVLSPDDPYRVASDLRYLVKGRPENKSHRGYDGLVSMGYVKPTWIKKEERKPVEQFFLTLKGCLFAIGYNFDEIEAADFIKNAAQNHIFFAYLDSIVEKTSREFVIDIFIEPVRELIEKDLIIFDGKFNLEFFFDIIRRSIEEKVTYRLQNLVDSTHFHERESFEIEMDKLEGVVYENILSVDECTRQKQFLQTLIENTFYGKYDGWDYKMKSYYYPNKKAREFYDYFSDENFIPSRKWIENNTSYSLETRSREEIREYLQLFGHNWDDVKKKAWTLGDEAEIALLNTVMKAIHFAFYSSVGFDIPARHPQSIPRSKYSSRRIRLKTLLSSI